MAGDYTATQVEVARIILDEHARVCVPEPVCGRCLKRWPCRDFTWATDVMTAFQPNGVPPGVA